MNKKKKSFFLLVVIILILFSVFLFSFLKKKFSSNEEVDTEPKVLATTTINQSFTFLAENEVGEEADEVSLTLTLAKKAKKIGVRGQPIETEGGKVFLVLDFEMENETDEPLFLYPPNLIRLLGEEEKKFAPDFHNDLARIEPISVKKDQVGFIVSEEESNFTILVGEIEAEKEKIEINF